MRLGWTVTPAPSQVHTRRLARPLTPTPTQPSPAMWISSELCFQLSPETVTSQGVISSVPGNAGTAPDAPSTDAAAAWTGGTSWEPENLRCSSRAFSPPGPKCSATSSEAHTVRYTDCPGAAVTSTRASPPRARAWPGWARKLLGFSDRLGSSMRTSSGESPKAVELSCTGFSNPGVSHTRHRREGRTSSRRMRPSVVPGTAASVTGLKLSTEDVGGSTADSCLLPVPSSWVKRGSSGMASLSWPDSAPLRCSALMRDDFPAFCAPITHTSPRPAPGTAPRASRRGVTPKPTRALTTNTAWGSGRPAARQRPRTHAVSLSRRATLGSKSALLDTTTMRGYTGRPVARGAIPSSHAVSASPMTSAGRDPAKSARSTTHRSV